MHRAIFTSPACHLKWLTLVVLFVFCQVMGAMCTLPNLSLAADRAMISDGDTVCPMDGTLMCPPSITSSPERQGKGGVALDLDHSLSSVSRDETLLRPSPLAPSPPIASCSIVFPTLMSLPVLRI